MIRVATMGYSLKRGARTDWVRLDEWSLGWLLVSRGYGIYCRHFPVDVPGYCRFAAWLGGDFDLRGTGHRLSWRTRFRSWPITQDLRYCRLAEKGRVIIAVTLTQEQADQIRAGRPRA